MKRSFSRIPLRRDLLTARLYDMHAFALRNDLACYSAREVEELIVSVEDLLRKLDKRETPQHGGDS